MSVFCGIFHLTNCEAFTSLNVELALNVLRQCYVYILWHSQLNY